MSELKPCPFCGKEILMDGTVYNINTHGEPRVYCANCGATGPNDVSYGRADEMWNLRRPEDALRACIAELEARITELSQAVGLITTLKPTMVMDANHPLDMVREVAEHVTARIARLEAATRWIPVEERLPEKNEMVVVYVAAYGSVETARHIPEIPQWTTSEGIYLHGESYDDITHWQPLPKPPEAQE